MRFHRSQASEGDHDVVRTTCWVNRAYDAEAIRQGLRVRHILPLLAERRTKHGIHEAFLSLGCGLICWQSLRKRWMTG
jgi:hypothetical protein